MSDITADRMDGTPGVTMTGPMLFAAIFVLALAGLARSRDPRATERLQNGERADRSFECAEVAPKVGGCRPYGRHVFPQEVTDGFGERRDGPPR